MASCCCLRVRLDMNQSMPTPSSAMTSSSMRILASCEVTTARSLGDRKAAALTVRPDGVWSGAPRRAAGPARDLGGGVVVQVDAQQARGPRQHPLELGVGVEVQVRGEPEAVAQRCRQQARPGRGTDHRERWQGEPDRVRPRALADDDVDPEVLHGDVQQLLGRPGEELLYVAMA